MERFTVLILLLIITAFLTVFFGALAFGHVFYNFVSEILNIIPFILVAVVVGLVVLDLVNAYNRFKRIEEEVKRRKQSRKRRH
ncbi:MAG: hypothetical protein QXL51_07800 [Candidatus Aenigmatarchaeota archaeon]